MSTSPILPSRRLRATPYSKRVTTAGATAYTIYNHMFLATVFENIEADCRHLKEYAQIWDVSVERQVELRGPDARKLATMMSARDLSDAVEGRCYYAPILNVDGRFINDPVALCLGENHFWFSTADGDMLQWAQGLAAGLGYDVTVCEPDVSPLAIQGPMAEDLMADVFGEDIRDIKFFRFKRFEFMGRNLIVARSGWSKQGGFEIYLDQFDLGEALWDTIWDKGAPYNLRAGCPNLIERLEGGLLSLGNDMTNEDTPLEAGLGRFIALDGDHDFIGKAALLAQREEGIRRRLIGLLIDGAPITPVGNVVNCYVDDQELGKVGFITSAAYSPDFDSNLGFAMLSIDIELGDTVSVTLNDIIRQATVCNIPFPKN